MACISCVIVDPVTPAMADLAFGLFGHQEAINYELNLKNMKVLLEPISTSANKVKMDQAALFNVRMSGPPTGPINGLVTAGCLPQFYGTVQTPSIRSPIIG